MTHWLEGVWGGVLAGLWFGIYLALWRLVRLAERIAAVLEKLERER